MPSKHERFLKSQIHMLMDAVIRLQFFRDVVVEVINKQPNTYFKDPKTALEFYMYVDQEMMERSTPVLLKRLTHSINEANSNSGKER